MRARDQVATSALRSALGAIGDAEAVPAGQLEPPPGVAARTSPEPCAAWPRPRWPGSASTPANLDAIMRTEISERERAADDYAAKGLADQAERLRREASVLTSALLPADHD